MKVLECKPRFLGFLDGHKWKKVFEGYPPKHSLWSEKYGNKVVYRVCDRCHKTEKYVLLYPDAEFYSCWVKFDITYEEMVSNLKELKSNVS